MTESALKSEVITPEFLRKDYSSNDVMSKQRSESVGSKNLTKDDSSKALKESQDALNPKQSSSDMTQSSMEAGTIFTENQLEGLSDLVKNKKTHDEKGRNGQRGSMGEYAMAKKSKPSQFPTPGPSHYSPKVEIIKPSAPQYSIAGRVKYVEEYLSPGPNIYKVDEDLLWKDKTIRLKGRMKKSAIESMNSNFCSTFYNVTNGNFGTVAPKYTIGSKAAIRNGPPNTLVQAVDTFGAQTPGPADYKPNSVHLHRGVEVSFAKESNRKGTVSTSPGPGEYMVPIRTDRGPHWSFGMKYNDIPGTVSSTPGPGTYDIHSTIGRSVAKSILKLLPNKKNEDVPSPDTYLILQTTGKAIKPTMTYRPFAVEVEETPGPSDYDPRNKNKRNGPEFSCGRQCPLSYPEILHHWKHASSVSQGIAPNSYNLCQDIAKNDKPRYSMGKRLKQNIEESPGPASYYNINNIKRDKQIAKGKKPGFSFGKRIKENLVKPGPGPAAYTPKSTKSGPSYSISGWNQIKQGASNDYPAANQYTIGNKVTRTGNNQGPVVSFKGRPISYV